MKNIQTIILAAGKGTRMNRGRPSPIPKALYPISGKPMVSYILKTLNNLKIRKPILVVGYKADLVKQTLGDACEYAIQKRRLGTGHAAKLAIEYIARNYKFQITNDKQISNVNFLNSKQSKKYGLEHRNHLKIDTCNLVLILQADDSVFYQTKTLENFIKNHRQKQATLSFLTTKSPDPGEMGRVVRGKNGQVLAIKEREHLTKTEKKIKEINCGAYLINLDWAKDNIKKIQKTLKGGREYPLPDVVKIALEQNKKVLAFPIPREQWIGINSPEQLAKAEGAMKRTIR